MLERCAPLVHILVPVEDVVVAVLDCPELERGQVGAGPGLAEALAVHRRAVGDLREEARLLLLGAIEH